MVILTEVRNSEGSTKVSTNDEFSYENILFEVPVKCPDSD